MSNLSDYAKDSIRQILSESGKVLAEDMEDVVRDIERTCWDALGATEIESSALKKEISALETAIRKTLEKIDGLSLHSRLAIDDYIDEEDEEKDEELARFVGSGITGEGLYNLRIYAEAAHKAMSNALPKISVRRGPPANVAAKVIAFSLNESLSDLDIPTTSYVDGTYLKILSAIFDDLLPTEKAESYLRHGKWALRVKDNWEVDWFTMSVRR